MGFLKAPKPTKPRTSKPRLDIARDETGHAIPLTPVIVRSQFHQGEVQDLATAVRTWLNANKNRTWHTGSEVDTKRARMQGILAKLEGMP